MLIIRNAQLAAIEQAARLSFVRAMIAHLREHFPGEFAGYSTGRLSASVETALDEARRLGLTSKLDCCRFLNLCAACGWDFLARPETDWMREALSDAGNGAPSARLRRLTEMVIHRQRVEERNLELRNQFEPPRPNWRELPDDPADAVWDGDAGIESMGASA